MTSVLIRMKKMDKITHRGKINWVHREKMAISRPRREAHSRSLLHSPQLCKLLDLGWLASRAMRPYISPIWATQSEVLCHSSPSKGLQINDKMWTGEGLTWLGRDTVKSVGLLVRFWVDRKGGLSSVPGRKTKPNQTKKKPALGEKKKKVPANREIKMQVSLHPNSFINVKEASALSREHIPLDVTTVITLFCFSAKQNGFRFG